MENVIKISNEKVATKDGREFTKIVGGFGEDKPIITIRQVSELTGLEMRVVNQTITRNKNHFENGVHIIDLKSESHSVTDFKNSITNNDTLKVLTDLGYNKQSIANSRNIYILSEAGFLLYLKFAEGDKAIELYKDFIEDYFKTRAENESMKNSIEEELIYLKDQRALALGKMFMEQDPNKKMELFTEQETINNRIIELENSINTNKILEKLQPQLETAKILTESSKDYDIGIFSKILGVKGLGRNNFFKWMREEEILMKDNSPYQRYSEYFSITPVKIKKGSYETTEYKTRLKPCGVDFIVKRLIKKNYIVPKSIEAIKEELDKTAA